MTPSYVPSRRIFTAATTLIGASFALHGLPALAQEPTAPAAITPTPATDPTEIELLRQQLAAMQARLDKLEAAQKEAAAKPAAPPAPDAAKPAPPVTAASKTPLVVSFLGQLEPITYLHQSRDTGALADTFRIRRSEIRITAPNITSRISGTVMFDPAKTNNLTNSGSLLQEIVATYNFDTNKKAPQFFDIGQFKPGFGYESDQVSSGALQTVERALIYSFRDLAASSAPTIDPDGAAGPLPAVPSGLPATRQGGGFGDFREQGARLRGSFGDGALAYNFGVFNGLGERQNATAGGDAKAYVGRLSYRPGKTPVHIGVSGLRGNTRDSASPALGRDGYGAFLVYKKNKINFQSEWARLNSKRQNDGAFYRNGTGYYAGVGYMIAPKVELVARYDTLKIGARLGGAAAASGVRTKEYTLGGNYLLKGNYAKIQVNLVKVEDDLPKATTGNGLQLRTNFQVGF